jgi:hypothetical protein
MLPIFEGFDCDARGRGAVTKEKDWQKRDIVIE